MIGLLSLCGAILFGALGFLAIVASTTGEKGAGLLSWAAWLLYIPAFTLLFFAFEAFGVARAYALWAAGTAVVVSIQGVRWGDKPTARQLIAMTLVVVGLLIFSLDGR